jgi:hypothetical protein
MVSSSLLALSSHGSDAIFLGVWGWASFVSVGVGAGVTCAALFASSACRRSSDLGSANESVRLREGGIEIGVCGRLARPGGRFGVLILRSVSMIVCDIVRCFSKTVYNLCRKAVFVVNNVFVPKIVGS